MKQYTKYLMDAYGFSESQSIQIENAYIILYNAVGVNFSIDTLINAILHD
jgi:hypothetical protein